MTPKPELLERSRRRLSDADSRRGHPPETAAVGDLLTFPESGRAELLWALLAGPRAEGGGESTWTVVPVDTFPAVGARDVAIREHAGDARIVRGAHAVAIALPGDWNTRWQGRLPHGILDRAHSRQESVALGGSPSDDDPELVEWSGEVLASAAEALQAAFPVDRAADSISQPSLPEPPPEPIPLRPVERRWQGFAMAASVTLAVLALALAWTQAERARQATDALAAARTAPPESTPLQPLAEVPSTWLDVDEGAVRDGAPVAVETIGTSPYSLLILTVPERYSQFEVRLEFAPVSFGGASETWRQDPVRPNASGELVVLLPTELLQRGPARVTVLARTNDGPMRLLEKELFSQTPQSP